MNKKLFTLAVTVTIIIGSVAYIGLKNNLALASTVPENVEGYLDLVTVDMDTYDIHVHGWAIDYKRPGQPVSIIFTDGKLGSGKVVGFAVTGIERQDVNAYLGKRAAHSPRGYRAVIDEFGGSSVNAYAVLGDGQLKYLGTKVFVNATEPLTRPIDDTDDVVIETYCSLEGPFCKRLHPTLKKLVEDYNGRVKLDYKHFPLTALHPSSETASVAAECVRNQAGDEGYIGFIDGIYNIGDGASLNNSLYEKLAKNEGVNINRFSKCLVNGETLQRVREDLQEGTDRGVVATPTSFINGRELVGAQSYEAFEAIIEEELAK